MQTSNLPLSLTTAAERNRWRPRPTQPAANCWTGKVSPFQLSLERNQGAAPLQGLKIFFSWSKGAFDIFLIACPSLEVMDINWKFFFRYDAGEVTLVPFYEQLLSSFRINL